MADASDGIGFFFIGVLWYGRSKDNPILGGYFDNTGPV